MPTLTPESLQAHLEPYTSAAAPVPLAALLSHQPISCVDGRKPEAIIGAPGGNAGLFALLLAAYEAHTGQPLAAERVHALLAAYLDQMGPFYLHTDTTAMAPLEAALQQAPTLQTPLAAAADLETFVTQPPPEARPALLALLQQPAHIGCGHLRLMCTYPAEYGTRADLVDVLLEAYFARLWDGDARLLFDILEGLHDEGAVVNVCTHDTQGLGTDTHLSAAPPHQDGVQVFVHHPEAVAFVLNAHADFLAKQGLLAPDERTAFLDRQRALADRQLQATLGHLAADLPIYTAAHTPDGLAVSEAGA